MQYWFLSFNRLFRNSANRWSLALLAVIYSVNVSALDIGDPHHVKPSDEMDTMSSNPHLKFDRITGMDDFITRQPVPNVNVRGIGIFVYEGMFSQDALAPLQVFKSAGLNVFLIAKQKGLVTTSSGLTIVVDKSIVR